MGHGPRHGIASGVLVDRLRALVTGYGWTAALHAAVRSGVVDALGPEALSPGEVAASAGALQEPVRRLLRALVVLELAAVDADGRYVACAELEPLRPGGALRDALLFFGSIPYRSWGELPATVRTGISGHEVAYGQGHWELLAADPDAAATFNRAMAGLSRPVLEALPAALALSEETVVDVGGGSGHLLAALLTAAPRARGIVFDRPGLRDDAETVLAGFGDRARFEGGDFFARVPAGDVLVLKWIVHDWGDADGVRLLRRCREALRPGGRVVVVERLLPDAAELGPEALDTVRSDLMMLALFGAGSGRERTEAEVRGLLGEAGFAEVACEPLAGPFCVLTARVS